MKKYILLILVLCATQGHAVDAGIQPQERDEEALKRENEFNKMADEVLKKEQEYGKVVEANFKITEEARKRVEEAKEEARKKFLEDSIPLIQSQERTVQPQERDESQERMVQPQERDEEARKRESEFNKMADEALKREKEYLHTVETARRRVEKAGKKVEEAKEKSRKKFVEDSIPLYEAPLDAGEREASESVDDKKAVEIRPLNQTRPIKRPN